MCGMMLFSFSYSWIAKIIKRMALIRTVQLHISSGFGATLATFQQPCQRCNRCRDLVPAARRAARRRARVDKDVLEL